MFSSIYSVLALRKTEGTGDHGNGTKAAGTVQPDGAIPRRASVGTPSHPAAGWQAVRQKKRIRCRIYPWSRCPGRAPFQLVRTRRVRDLGTSCPGPPPESVSGLFALPLPATTTGIFLTLAVCDELGFALMLSMASTTTSIPQWISDAMLAGGQTGPRAPPGSPG